MLYFFSTNVGTLWHVSYWTKWALWWSSDVDGDGDGDGDGGDGGDGDDGDYGDDGDDGDDCDDGDDGDDGDGDGKDNSDSIQSDTEFVLWQSDIGLSEKAICWSQKELLL